MSGLKRLIQEIHRRSLWQVILIYLGASWAVLEAADLFTERFGLPDWLFSGALVLLLIGLPVVVMTALVQRVAASSGLDRTAEAMHGEAGGVRRLFTWRNAISGGVFALALWGVVATGWYVLYGGATQLPLVVMMDSPHPRRVYDEETIAANGTNADVISDILLDLPIRRQKEATGPDWHRDEEILRFHPALIVIHYSSFRQEEDSGPRLRLELFIEFFAASETEVLIYGRRREAWLRARVDELLRDLDKQHPGLLARMHVFGVIDYGTMYISSLRTPAEIDAAVSVTPSPSSL